MKTIIFLAFLTLSLSSFADTLECHGQKTRTLLTSINSGEHDATVLVSIWSKGNKNEIADLMEDGITADSVKELMDKGLIRSTNIFQSFKLDLAAKKLTLLNDDGLLTDTITCRYKK